MIEQVYGDRLLRIPYVMPGFKLAALCADLYPRLHGAATIGMVLMNHGIFTWAPTARESYERMIDMVALAESYIDEHVRGRSRPSAPAVSSYSSLEVAGLRRELSDVAGTPMILQVDDGPDAVAFANRADVSVISQQGPATPDHVIRTKRLPMLGRDVATYATRVRAVLRGTRAQICSAVAGCLMQHLASSSTHRWEWSRQDDPRSMRPSPRTSTGTPSRSSSTQPSSVVTVPFQLRTSSMSSTGTWSRPSSERARRRHFTGEVALVTGAASGIGRACAELLLQQGAAVVGLDLNPDVASVTRGPAWLGLQCDVTNPEQVTTAIEASVTAVRWHRHRRPQRRRLPAQSAP